MMFCSLCKKTVVPEGSSAAEVHLMLKTVEAEPKQQSAYNIRITFGRGTHAAESKRKQNWFRAWKKLVIKQRFYDNPESMYCNPINCYCAKILGDLNQITIDNKTYYLRPEKIKLSDDSKFEGVVEKSLFAGKEYKVSVNVNNENWIFFNDL